MGNYMIDELKGLQDRQPVIGNVKDLGLFTEIELVMGRESNDAR